MGWDVIVVSGSTAYRKGKGAGWKRWVRELSAHARLFIRGLLAPRPDVILCLTDPPCLPFTAMVLARCRGVPLAHWAMDVYPEIAAALGEVKKDGLLFRTLKRAMRAAYDDCAFIACLDQDMAEAMHLQGDPRVMICPPWPAGGLMVPEKPVSHTERERFRWLYSGNLGRAHDHETLLQTQRLLEDEQVPFELVFQGGGPCREAAQQRAEALGLKHCLWQDFVTEETLISSLLDADVLVATQKPETRGLLWPSKLSLLLTLPRPVAWVGPLEGEISRYLNRTTHGHGTFAPGDSRGMASWLINGLAVFRANRDKDWHPEEVRVRLNRLLQNGAEEWHHRLKSVIVGKS